MISLDVEQEERVRALIEKYVKLPPENPWPLATIQGAVMDGIALGYQLKLEELSCARCHRKQDLPWYCKDCENKGKSPITIGAVPDAGGMMPGPGGLIKMEVTDDRPAFLRKIMD